MERQKNDTFMSVWICRDWAGPHIFMNKPKRIKNGCKEDEWYDYPSSLNDVSAVKSMINDFTNGWDVNHEPQKITIKFEIL